MPEILSLTIDGTSNNISSNLDYLVNNFLNNTNITPYTETNVNYCQTYNAIKKKFKILKSISYVVIIAIVFIILLLIYSNRHIFTYIIKNGLIKTIINYPIITIISGIINFTITMYFTHKNYLNTLEKLSKILCKKSKDKTHTNKTIWHDISDICNFNLENIYTQILDDFQNTDINTIFDNPLSEIINTNDDKIPETLKKFEKNNKINLVKWKENIEKLKSLFTEKYKSFKDYESKLLEIKDSVKELNDWKIKTKKLFDKLNDKSKVNLILESHVEKKINETGLHDLLVNYKNLYLELKVILKYINKNPETETISKCPICLTNVKDSFIIPCGHCVCKECLEQQSKINKKLICPICRMDGTKIGKLFY